MESDEFSIEWKRKIKKIDQAPSIIYTGGLHIPFDPVPFSAESTQASIPILLLSLFFFFFNIQISFVEQQSNRVTMGM